VAERQDRFEWDDANREHIARHGITPEEFEEGMNNGPVFVAEFEVRGERRTRVAGMTHRGRLLELVYTLRCGRVRAVTAFPLKRNKRGLYSWPV
jgi:hypothetical protein